MSKNVEENMVEEPTPTERPAPSSMLMNAILLILGCSIGANVWLGREVIDLQEQVNAVQHQQYLRKVRADLMDLAQLEFARKKATPGPSVYVNPDAAVYEDQPSRLEVKSATDLLLAKPMAGPAIIMAIDSSDEEAEEPQVAVAAYQSSASDDRRNRDLDGVELFGPDSPVVQITSHEQFDLLRGDIDGKPVFVNYYVSWCIWSQRLVPEYEKLAEVMSDDAVIAAVDCTAHAELCGRERVMAFPTLRLFVWGQAVRPDFGCSQENDVGADHRSARTMSEYIFQNARGSDSFEEDASAPEVVHDRALETSPDEDKDQIFGREESAGEEGERDAPYDEVESGDGKGGADGGVQVTRNSIDEKKSGFFSVKSPGLQLKEGDFDYSDGSNSKAIFITFYAPWCVWCQRLAPAFNELAARAENASHPFHVGAVDCMAQYALCRRERVLAFPSIRLYAGGKRISSDYKMDRTVNDMFKFVQDILETHQTTGSDYAEKDLPSDIHQKYNAVTLPGRVPIQTENDDEQESEDDRAGRDEEEFPANIANEAKQRIVYADDFPDEDEVSLK